MEFIRSFRQGNKGDTMKATVKKADLAKAISVIKKLGGSSKKIFLNVTKKGVLQIIENFNNYVKYNIPVEDFEPGFVALSTDVFNNFPVLKSDDIKLETVSNVLKMTSNIEHKLYCLDATKEEMQISTNGRKENIELSAKGVGLLKNLVDLVNFKTADQNSSSSLLIVNDKNGLHIKTADSVHCAFYTTKAIPKTKFELLTDLTLIKNVCSLLESNATLTILQGNEDKNETSTVLIESLELMTTIPLKQTGLDFIESANAFFNDSSFKKGKIIFDLKAFEDVLQPLNIVSEGADSLKLKINKKTMALGLSTSFGKSKATFTLDENSIGNLEFEVPIILFEDILHSCAFGEKIEFRFSTEENFYLLTTSKGSKSVQCVAPVATH